MYQSEAINQFLECLNSKEKPQKEKDKELIERFNQINSSSYNGFIEAILMIISFFGLFIGIASINTIFTDKTTLYPFFSQGLLFLLIGIIPFFVLFVLIKKGNIENLKKILSLLMTTPYEVRIESLGLFNNKIKIIIEENVISNGSVIKEKTRHITAYSSFSLNQKDLINFTLELAQKAENSFSNSKKSQ